jgi:hypothetical protein
MVTTLWLGLLAAVVAVVADEQPQSQPQPQQPHSHPTPQQLGNEDHVDRLLMRTSNLLSTPAVGKRVEPTKHSQHQQLPVKPTNNSQAYLERKKKKRLDKESNIALLGLNPHRQSADENVVIRSAVTWEDFLALPPAPPRHALSMPHALVKRLKQCSSSSISGAQDNELNFSMTDVSGDRKQQCNHQHVSVCLFVRLCVCLFVCLFHNVSVCCCPLFDE